KYKTACYLNQPSWWFAVFNQDIVRTGQYCQQLPTEYRWACADAVGRIIVTTRGNDVTGIQEDCGEVGSLLEKLCLRSVATSSFSVGNSDLPFTICQNIKEDQGRKDCSSDLVHLFVENNFSK